MIAKASPTTKRFEVIDKKKFAVIAIDENFKTFALYIVALEAESLILIYPTKKTQILT